MPDTVGGGVVSYTIKAAGAPIPGSYQVSAIHIDQAVNRIATATITLLDGDPSAESFAISASDSFKPGNEIDIEAGYDGTNTLLFSGIVTRQSIRVHSGAGPVLEIECKDKAVRMTVGRKSANYSTSKDSDVIATLIGNVPGLAAEVSATANVVPTLVQYYATDWDYMLMRAEVNGMLVSTINNTVRVFDPTASTASVLTLTYGLNIYSVDAQLNALTQLNQVTASAWDVQNQQLIKAQAANTLAGPGNLSSKELASVAGLDHYDVQTSAAESSAELSSWAKAQMLKSALSKITARVRFQGSAVVPGNYVTVSGLGARFDGLHLVSAVRHDIADGDWRTEASLGLSDRWFVHQHQIEAPPAAGLLPAIGGLYNATVKQINDDPDNEFRILVDVPLFNDSGAGLWARHANFYSTNGQGVFFLPEVGDEVVVGFLSQDPRFPVILGSLYSQKNPAFSAFAPNAQNTMKGIVSKSELRILFDDANKVLQLITPGNNTLVLDDKQQQVALNDQNGNSLVMSSAGITLKSAASITLQAPQNVTIKGDAGIAVQSTGGDVTTAGVNIKETAQAQFLAKGSATAEVQGGVQLTLKAAMVMIN